MVNDKGKINETSDAGAIFGAMEKRGRPILSAQERRVLALKQAGEQAKFELENLDASIANLQAKREEIVERLEKVAADYKQALAEQEGK